MYRSLKGQWEAPVWFVVYFRQTRHPIEIILRTNLPMGTGISLVEQLKNLTFGLYLSLQIHYIRVGVLAYNKEGHYLF